MPPWWWARCDKPKHAKVLNGLLFAVTPWLVLVAMALFLVPGPVQRWGTASLEHLQRWRADSGVRRAAPFLTQMLLLPPRIRDRVGGHGLAPGYVVRWWRARPLAGPFKSALDGFGHITRP